MTTLSVGMAVGSVKAASGFAEGGFTGSGGRFEVAGLVHRGEFVVPAPAVQALGLPFLESLRTGAASRLPAANSGAPLNVIVVDRRARAQELLDSSEGRAKIVEIAGEERHRFA